MDGVRLNNFPINDCFLGVVGLLLVALLLIMMIVVFVVYCLWFVVV